MSRISFWTCCCSVSQSCLTLYNAMDCSLPGFPVLHHLPELAQTHVHWVSAAIQSSHPLLSPSPPTFSLFQHQNLTVSQLFTSGSQSIGTSASVLPMNIQGWFPLSTGLISLQSKGLFKSLLQHHCSKALILRCSANFMIQTSHPWMTIGKNIALTIWIFVSKVMSLLFNTLSRFVMAFLPRSKHLLIYFNLNL